MDSAIHACETQSADIFVRVGHRRFLVTPFFIFVSYFAELSNNTRRNGGVRHIPWSPARHNEHGCFKKASQNITIVDKFACGRRRRRARLTHYILSAWRRDVASRRFVAWHVQQYPSRTSSSCAWLGRHGRYATRHIYSWVYWLTDTVYYFKTMHTFSR